MLIEESLKTKVLDEYDVVVCGGGLKCLLKKA